MSVEQAAERLRRCKYCGAAASESDVSVTRFLCESYVNGGEWSQSPDCMAEELRTLRALRERFDAAPTYWGARDDLGRLQWIPSALAARSIGIEPVLCKLVPVEDVT